MEEYFKKTEFILKELKFYYLGKLYTGRGVMNWQPEQGFHIEAPLDLHNKPNIGEVRFGEVRVVQKSDISFIRLFPKQYK